jgi:choline dehydrogenase-like flavoprotein
MRTGNLTLRPHSVVHSVTYKDGKATGVLVIDANTKESIEYKAKVIFVNAATFNTNLLLLNSKSDRFPDGLGNDSGTLGKYVAFHNYRASISASYDGYADKMIDGKSPTSAYIPRFRNVKKQETDFLRGYAAGFYSGKWPYREENGLGKELLDSMMTPPKYSDWRVSSHMMGETIPKVDNTITLDDKLVDEWGIPLLKAYISYDENDEKMILDYFDQVSEMFEKAGFANIEKHDSKQAPGLDIHEMGGVRMGHDPETSMLNKWNQMHACPNVFVTDGAAMTSVATQNPSLTFMAMSARSANYAVELLKKGELS